MEILLGLVHEMGLNPKRVASTRGGEYKSPCPDCGGVDRFYIQPSRQRRRCVGYYCCRDCGIYGDTISFCIDVMGMDVREAYRRSEAIEEPMRKPYRCFDKTERRIEEDPPPPIEWETWMIGFVDRSHEHLLRRPDMLSYVDKRGLPLEAVKRYQIGYTENPKDHFGTFRPFRSELGLPDGKQSKTIWLPKGIVIPSMDNGKVYRLKIRRTDWREGDEIKKYANVTGNRKCCSLIGDLSHKVIVVVESELCAYILHNQIRDFALVIATGGAGQNPDQATDCLCEKAKHLLIAHDKDEAGRKMWDKWSEMYPNARSYITNKGKDVSEAAEQGEDLREWVLSGLPIEFRERLEGARSLP